MLLFSRVKRTSLSHQTCKLREKKFYKMGGENSGRKLQSLENLKKIYDQIYRFVRIALLLYIFLQYICIYVCVCVYYE